MPNANTLFCLVFLFFLALLKENSDLQSIHVMFYFLTKELTMLDYKKQHLDEFFDLHRQDLEHSAIAKTTFFSDYVAYCNEHDYRHHTNLIQFSKAVETNSH